MLSNDDETITISLVTVVELNVNLGNVALVGVQWRYIVARWCVVVGGLLDGGGGRDKCAVEQRLCGVMCLCYDSIYSGNNKNEMKIQTVK